MGGTQDQRWKRRSRLDSQGGKTAMPAGEGIVCNRNIDGREKWSHKIEPGSQVWLYLDRVKEGFARKLRHMCHSPFRVTDLIGDHATRRIFPVVHLSNVKPVKAFPDCPTYTLLADEEGRVDFDDALLPEDSWETLLGEDEFEVGRIADVRAGHRAQYGRVHQEFQVFWKGYREPTWVDEADLNCGALLAEFERTWKSRSSFNVM
ncbi:hypothetical protein PHMEG_00026309 [Phytophthora megakarya]|uniref:Chromo domain-containing protein n=1 Tax=Phytophthora megakarya TaxID=4795 RepID=A0A225VAP7_9STRA|nr:hypothetical protein PHMEG_00026309 [Phytophthora megakarya]